MSANNPGGGPPDDRGNGNDRGPPDNSNGRGPPAFVAARGGSVERDGDTVRVGRGARESVREMAEKSDQSVDRDAAPAWAVALLDRLDYLIALREGSDGQ